MKLQFVVTVAFHQTEMPVVARQLGYKHIFCLNVVSTKKLLLLIIIIIGIQPVGRSGQRPELSQATGMALVRCNLGKFLGVACHCFPPIFRCSHFSPPGASTPATTWEIPAAEVGTVDENVVR